MLDFLETFYIQSSISLQGIMQSRTVLCKSRRVKNNKIILIIITLKILKCVFTKSLVTGITRKIKFYIIICKLYSLGTTIYRMHQLSLSTHGINRKATGIAKHIKYTTPLRVFLQQTSTFSLINKKSGFLST